MAGFLKRGHPCENSHLPTKIGQPLLAPTPMILAIVSQCDLANNYKYTNLYLLFGPGLFLFPGHLPFTIRDISLVCM